MKSFAKRLSKNCKRLLIADGIMIAVICIVLLALNTPSEVQGLAVTGGTYSTLDLEWDKSANAVAYKVFRSPDGKDYKYIATTTDTSYTDKRLRTGRTYHYVVVARNGFRTSEIREGCTISAKPSLEAPKLEVDTSEGEMHLSYTPVDGAKGYEIIRDGEVIGKSDNTEYVDETAEKEGGEFDYEVRAYRYEDDPVYSEASNKANVEMFTLGKIDVEASDNDLLLKWAGSDHYSNYKIYNGDTEVGETYDRTYRLSDFELDKTYDFKLIGYTEDGSEQSPDVERRVKVVEEEMTNEEAIEAAVQWGIDIANDDSFTYGVGDRAHRYGCYFCQTNVGPRKNIKGKSKVNGHSYAKTYCCNPFVHACYAHGAGDPAMLKACQNGHGIAMKEKTFTRYGHWKNAGKVSKGNLRRGDVLVRSDHVMMYIGDGQIVHASGGGWDAGSIKVTGLKNRKYTFVMRYTGNGRGVKRVVKDVDENGKVIETSSEEA